MRVNEMILGVRGDVAVKIFGSDLAQLDALAQQTVKIIKSTSGAEDVYTPQNSGVQYLRIDVDRLAAGRLGLDIAQIEAMLRAQLEGKQLGIVQEAQRRTPVLLRGADSLRASPADFANLMLTLPNGTNVPLSTVARLERVEGPVKVDRERGARMVVVVANVRGRDLVGFVEEARSNVLKQVTLPEGYRMKWGGQFENQQRSAARLAVVVPIAIGLIFLLLFATFRSVRQAALILSNIPFAMIGGIFDVALGRIYVGAGFGRFHRAARHRGAERGGDGEPFQSARGARHGNVTRRHRRRKAAAASGADDRDHRCFRPHPALVRQRPRLGDPAPAGDRGDRRIGHFDLADADHAAHPLPPIRAGEMIWTNAC
jgi:hypothetical protein